MRLRKPPRPLTAGLAALVVLGGTGFAAVALPDEREGAPPAGADRRPANPPASTTPTRDAFPLGLPGTPGASTDARWAIVDRDGRVTWQPGAATIGRGPRGMRRYQGRFSGRDAACAIGIGAAAPGDARPAARSGAAAPESDEPPVILFRTRDLTGRDTDRALAVPRGC